MQGLTLKTIKKHPSLIPLFCVLASGMSAAILFTIRSATKNPDVSWYNKNNPEPWNEYKDKRFQFLDPAAEKRHIGYLERPTFKFYPTV